MLDIENLDLNIIKKELLSDIDKDEFIKWMDIYSFIGGKLSDILIELNNGNKTLYKFINLFPIEILDEFLSKNLESLNWVNISKFLIFNKEMIFRYKSNIDFTYLNLNSYMELSLSDIESLEKDSDVNINEFSGYRMNYNTISLRDDLTIDFVRKFKDKLNWDFLSSNIEFSEEEIEEFKDNVNWNIISICQEYSDDFKEKYNLEKYINRENDILFDDYGKRIDSKNIDIRYMLEEINKNNK